MYEFQMPSLGAAMDFGTVVEWRVEPGDSVERGDIICEVETQKGNIDVEIWEEGTVDELLIPVGERVPVGEPILRLDTGASGDVEAAQEESKPEAEVKPAEAAESTAADEVTAAETAPETTPSSEPSPAASAPVQRERPRSSPAARKRAAELGVDIRDVAGSGPQGAVLLEDIEEPAAGERLQQADAPEPLHPKHPRISPLARRVASEHGVAVDEVEGTGEHGAVTREDVEREVERRQGGREEGVSDRNAGLREAIGRAMAQSKREIPHYYLEETIDMSRALDWLGDYNEVRSISERLLSIVPMLKAVALACREHPAMNGFWRDDGFVPSEAVHVGVAVSMAGGGVVAPAIHDVDQKSCGVIMEELRDLVSRVRHGKLRSSEMTDPTITVTSLGDQGVERVYGVIYPPQVALVGLGRIHERPCARDGMVGVHPVVDATLAADHRVSDGIAGSRFLNRIAQLLQQPETL